MKSMKSRLWLVLIILVVTTGTACAADVHISAAASLRESVNELCERFARKNPGVRFFKNYAGTGILAKQLENGAPADIFISANQPWALYLQKKGILAGNSVPFTYNTLVFVGQPNSKVSSLQGLLKADRIAIGSPKSVPAGEYAMEAFRNAYLASQLEKKMVMAKDVRDCLTYAERGDVDGAVVYRTDALEAKRAKILFTVPQRLYEPIVYPMALTVSGSRSREANAFYQYLQSPEAKTVLARYGFQSH